MGLQAALTPAGLAAVDGLAGVPPEPWLAVVAVPPGCVVAAPLTNAPTPAARQPEQLRVEPAASRVLVAGAGWEQNAARAPQSPFYPPFPSFPPTTLRRETAWGSPGECGPLKPFILIFKTGSALDWSWMSPRGLMNTRGVKSGNSGRGLQSQTAAWKCLTLAVGK